MQTRDWPHVKGMGVDDLLLYGLDEAGETAFTERLSAAHRPNIYEIAADHLRHWHAVEVWEGPMCIVRIRREQGASG